MGYYYGDDDPLFYGLRLLADCIDHPSLQPPKQAKNKVNLLTYAAAARCFDNVPRKKRTPRIHQPRIRTSPPRKRKWGTKAKLESVVSTLLEGDDNSRAKNLKKNNDVERQHNNIDSKLCPKSPPRNLLALIESMSGTDVELVIRKKIQQTDLQIHHNRMSIPPTQLVKKDFLNVEEEKMFENKGDIKVSLVGPSLELIENHLSLRRWKMSRSFIYVLYNWNSIVKRNNFVEGEVIHLWSFRVAGVLWFALVREKDYPVDDA